MSYIYGEEVEVIVEKKRKVDGVKCDICGREIKPVERHWRDKKHKYFEVMTGHHDWGNDSYESIEHKHICPECIAGFVADYLNGANGTEYIEITTEHVYMGMME